MTITLYKLACAPIPKYRRVDRVLTADVGVLEYLR